MKKILPIAILVILSLAGCSGDGPRGEVRPTPISASAAAEGGGSAEEGGGVGQPILLRMWTHQNEPFTSAYQTLVDAYRIINPGVTITIETFDAATYEQAMQSALSSVNVADIVQLPGSAVCGHSAVLAPTPEVVITLANAQTAFYPDALGGFICNGALYGLPQEAATRWGLTVSNTGASQEVAWDFVRFVALDPANAALWNTTSGTPPALQANAEITQ